MRLNLERDHFEQFRIQYGIEIWKLNENECLDKFS